MTRNVIAEELWPILNGEPEHKLLVVGALVQIRKMLEHDGFPAQYSVLKFFCDWVVHPKLAGPGARELMKRIDRELPTLDPRNPQGWDPRGVIQETISFDLFRHELWAYLRVPENDLPTRWVEDDFTWTNVVQFYGQQVHNTPLVIDNDKHGLTYIRRVEIVSLEPSPEIVAANPGDKHFGFISKWVFTLNDDRSFAWSHTSNVPEKPANWPTQGIKTRG